MGQSRSRDFLAAVQTMRSRGVVRRSGIVILVLAALLGAILGITMLRVKAVGPG